MRTLARSQWLLVGVIAVVAAGLIIAAWAPARANDAKSKAGASPSVQGPNGRPSARPNIVFVLTDDLSWNLVKYMPEVQKLRTQGVTFSNYVVTDTLCCPSRSSIFTGNFPHDTGVYTNNSPDGGFTVFNARGNENHTYATALQADGYATAMMGKYLNGYVPTDNYVPPGWNEWDVGGKAYYEYKYDLDENHTVRHYGSAPADYLTDVLSAKGNAFIERNAAAGKPFVLEIGTYAPHKPYTPAPTDLNKFPGLKAPRTKAFDRLPVNPPAWLANHTPLSQHLKTKLDTVFRMRAQSVQAVDRMIGRLRATLEATGVADNTYFVFSSDNGFHLGEYRLGPGKQTAYDTDVRVPLVVVGPHVPGGVTLNQVAQNIDLAPTFESLAGLKIKSNVDGHSLVPLLSGKSPSDWRTASLIEHHGPDALPGDPDAQTPRQGIPPTYNALWTPGYTYVEYKDGDIEYYDRLKDPYELNNIAGQLSTARKAALHQALVGLRTCHTYTTCWAAGHVDVTPSL